MISGALVLLAAVASQSDPVIAALAPGTSRSSAERVLDGAKWLESKADRALADGLVKTRLLETLNKLELAPKDASKALDARAFEAIAVLAKNGRTYVAAFGGGKLRFLMVRMPVPVDGASESPRRIHKLREALAELDRFGMKPKQRDRYGNVFSWSSRSAAALYVPEEDELRVVTHD